MITRRKVMGWLGAVLGASATGAQAAVDPHRWSVVRQPDFLMPATYDMRRAQMYTEVVEQFVKLGREEVSLFPCFAIPEATMTHLWNDSTTRMLMELPKPTYEHRVIMGITGIVIVVRPTPRDGYWPWDAHKRLR